MSPLGPDNRHRAPRPISAIGPPRRALYRHQAIVRMDRPAESSAEDVLSGPKWRHLGLVTAVGVIQARDPGVLDPVVDVLNVQDRLDLAVFGLCHVPLPLQDDFVDAVLQHERFH